MITPARFLCAAAAALALHLSPLSAAPLTTPAALGARLESPKLRIVDIRDGKDAQGRTPYELGHVPGAVHAPYSQWRGPKDNPGRLPETIALTRLIQRLGIERDTEVVVVHEGKDATDFGAAARVYWTLKTAGIERPAILDGGMLAWRAAGRPLSTDPVAVTPSTHGVQIDERWLARRDDVARVQATRSARLLDARPRDFFEGDTRHVAARAPGTIAGAAHLDNALWFAPRSGVLLPADEVRRVAQANGLAPGSATDAVSFCNTGHWAATNWFVLSEVLGERNVRLYPESMVEWSAAGLPMDNVPNRLRQLLIDLRLAGS